MALGLIGQKIGMSRIFANNGEAVSVSIIKVEPNRIIQLKNQQTDGYDAIQVTMGNKKNSRLNKAARGHFTKANVEPGIGLWEFSVNDIAKYKVGFELTVELFEKISHVDVVGVSKGKGFAGVIRRHNFSSQDATHGNSLSHNVPGSIGQRQSPGKVFKGKKMAGHLGNKQVTLQNLKLFKIDSEKRLLLIAGGIPGPANGYVLVYPAKKLHKEEIYHDTVS
jgi:large subunit ribosomal protein L3